MKKPTPKKRAVLDFSECTAFIEQKYKCDTRDFARAHVQFGEWVAASGEKIALCKPGASEAEVLASQAQYQRYQADIIAGRIIERPYQDFWHWLIDVADVQRGGTLELSAEMGDGAEAWQKQILGYYLAEFGTGPYLTDW